MRRVYFDHLSATPVLPEALEAMRPFFSEAYGNASSLHQEGLRVREALAVAREQVAQLIHAESPEAIFFTSCGTEAANLAVTSSCSMPRHWRLRMTTAPAERSCPDGGAVW